MEFNAMKSPTKRLLFWTPRILSILFAVFLSLFALDVFGAGYNFWNTIRALLMHLIPTGIILAALVIAWRWEWIGGLVFIGLGMLYLVLAGGRFPWSTCVLMSAPPFLAGGLFLVSWLCRRTNREQQETYLL